MSNVCEITDYQVTLMFVCPHKATCTKTGKVFTTKPTKVAINEGKFVPSKDNQAFIAKAALRPALLTKNPPTSKKRNKPDSDSDLHT